MIGKSGVIFETNRSHKKKHKKVETLNGNSGVGQASEFPFKTSKPHKLRFPKTKFFRSRFGILLMFVALGGFLVTYGPLLQVEIGYRLVGSQTVAETSESPTASPEENFAQVVGKHMIGEIEGVPDPEFSISIPKIHAKAKVIPNVDTLDQTAYMEALKQGVAHAKGTGFPGGIGQNIYLFAHSTDNPVNVARFNAVFYLLRELEPSDTVEIYFAGVKHRYTVIEKKIVEADDVSYLSPTNPYGTEQLVLQTCWPPGTTVKRLLVIAEKAKNDE